MRRRPRALRECFRALIRELAEDADADDTAIDGDAALELLAEGLVKWLQTKG